MRKLIPLAMMLAMMTALAVPGSSSAKGDRDEYPCADPVWHSGRGIDVQYCYMWRGNVPVHADRDPDSPVVGHLKTAKGNWFECQAEGVEYRAPKVPGNDLSGQMNNWWAATVADNGEWGWAPEAFFVNGGNDIPNGNFPDGNLAKCFEPG